MPHKHKRKRDDDKSNFDLPPSSRAKALPTLKSGKDGVPNKRRKTDPKGPTDDTPKQFARLMAWQNEGKKLPRGLDNGEKVKKKKHNAVAGQDSTSLSPKDSKKSEPPSATPKILPGERLADFAIRVDRSLPMNAVPKTSTQPGLGLKAPLTKHNKRLARMQSEWRNTEARLKAKEEEEGEELADTKEEHGLLWMDVEDAKVRRKGKKSKGTADSGDPWKVLEKKRREEGTGHQRNLQDVVQAPPLLKGVKNIFKDRKPSDP